MILSIYLWLFQTAPDILPDPNAFDLSKLITSITMVLVPVLVWAAKKGMAFLPSWSLPLIAIVLGGLIDVLNGLATGSSAGPLWGAILGAAGVGLREVIDQLKKVAKTK